MPQDNKVVRSVLITPAEGRDGASLKIREKSVFGPRYTKVTLREGSETLQRSAVHGDGYGAKRVTATRLPGHEVLVRTATRTDESSKITYTLKSDSGSSEITPGLYSTLKQTAR